MRRAHRRAEEEERRLHRELEEQHQQLELRVRELTALNQMFQRHLEERFGIVEAYREILAGLQKLEVETSALIDRAKSQPIPDVADIPSTGQGDSDASIPR